jgi:steroid delta-isomerase-like uncharacterized protein
VSSLEQTKALMRNYIEEAWNKGNLDFIDENFSSDFVAHGTFSRQPNNRVGVKSVITTIRNAIPDLHITIEDMLAEGDKVASRWVTKGTHKGGLMGSKPSGNRISVSETAVFRVKDGKVVEGWANRDDLGFLQQIGLIPPVG